MLYLGDLDTSLPRLMGLIEKVGSYAGYKRNIPKMQILLFNYVPPKEIKNEYNINWKAKVIKYLGTYITKDPLLMYEANSNCINVNIKQNLERWSTYPLDFSSKINVVKIYILPRLLCLFQSLPIEVPASTSMGQNYISIYLGWSKT